MTRPILIALALATIAILMALASPAMAQSTLALPQPGGGYQVVPPQGGAGAAAERQMSRRRSLRDSRPTRHAALALLLASAPMDVENKPVTVAEVIAGGQTIATH
jgi:hypothetical protein